MAMETRGMKFPDRGAILGMTPSCPSNGCAGPKSLLATYSLHWEAAIRLRSYFMRQVSAVRYHRSDKLRIGERQYSPLRELPQRPDCVTEKNIPAQRSSWKLLSSTTHPSGKGVSPTGVFDADVEPSNQISAIPLPRVETKARVEPSGE